MARYACPADCQPVQCSQTVRFAIKRLYDVAGVDQINNAVIDQRSLPNLFVHIPDPFKERLPTFSGADLIKRL